MLRQTIINVIRPAHRSTVGQVRSFSMSAIRSTEGATGAPRSGGTAQGDSFTKREKANEDYYVKQQEKAKSVVPRPVPKATREHNIPITNVRRKQTLTLDVVVFRLLALKEKISQQRKQLEELDKNIEELTKEGEQK
ncbi:MAG: hypothetical protein FRX48_00573 [Lasallia pustulata]|uniref:ATPase inhibitor, mitochondrial n=1 Tax=Lasallia pustulata TaxID=136370 RepID=A0A5M8Q3S0_9LECA|nr:MAG: hypothetical protein FRX48_00573 [Lasallia pustulata]